MSVNVCVCVCERERERERGDRPAGACTPASRGCAPHRAAAGTAAPSVQGLGFGVWGSGFRV